MIQKKIKHSRYPDEDSLRAANEWEEDRDEIEDFSTYDNDMDWQPYFDEEESDG